MRPRHLVYRGLTYYWRTNLAVVLGVATAVTVLAGALIVGDSVRGSLRDLVLQRLGRTDLVLLSSTDFFREQLAEDIRTDGSFAANYRDICPIIAVQGLATDQASGQRSLGVQVYGVDDRFWRFHDLAVPHGKAQDTTAASGPNSGAARDVLLSPALAREIGAAVGGTILLRIQRPSDTPLDSLHGRKDDVGRPLRLTLGGVLSADELGEFSLRPQQGDVRAAFVPLARLQQDLDLQRRVNALLVSRAVPGHQSVGVEPDTTIRETMATLVRQHTTIEDLGLRVRALEPQRALSVETSGTLIDTPRAEAALATATALGMRTEPVFTYLVNSISVRQRQTSGLAAGAIPYSLVTAIDLATIAPGALGAPGAPGLTARTGDLPPILLNEWAARDLHARLGDEVTLDFLAWEDPGLLKDRSAAFRLAAVVPITGAAADRDLVPVYPGVTNSENLRDWDPPFPIDLHRVRPRDEDYWHTYRTTPKAFVPLETGQSLWQSRHGALTSIRLTPSAGTSLSAARTEFVRRLGAALDPSALGLSAHNVRSEGLAASRGATDFGEYFTYFSFFLVASALLLAVLFFKLGIEQRGREIGLLRAVGFMPASIRRLFVLEGLIVSVAGSGVGLFGAVGYGYLMMAGLRTWWVDAVGTTALTLHVSATSLAAGGVGGVVAAIAGIWWTLRSLKHVSERSLLAGRVSEYSGAARRSATRGGGSRTSVGAAGLLLGGLLLIAGSLAGWIGDTGAFFGAGAALLASCLCGLTALLHRPSSRSLSGHGWRPLSLLGLRNTTHRPGRSVLAVAVMASATFVVMSVSAFRKDDARGLTDPRSGTGGYALLVNTLMPIVHDPGSTEGRNLLGLSSLPDVAVTPFRVRPGDDASCLNLYEPRQPRIVAVGPAFVAAGRFSFRSSLAASDNDRANAWRLLERPLERGVVPVIADANSMAYVLHKSLGDEIVVTGGSGAVRLRIVAALADSVFQGELLMSEANFLALFPDQPGYQLLLVDAKNRPVAELTSVLEDRLADFGADAVPVARRLAEFHKVENTYLSTFQTLGGLGLLLGTIGLAAVLLRNVLERRRELALLGAVGYRRVHILTIVMAENAFLLVAGLLVGTACALVAIAPAAIERGGRLPANSGAWLLLFAVLATGLLSSFIAARITIQARLLAALKAE